MQYLIYVYMFLVQKSHKLHQLNQQKYNRTSAIAAETIAETDFIRALGSLVWLLRDTTRPRTNKVPGWLTDIRFSEYEEYMNEWMNDGRTEWMYE